MCPTIVVARSLEHASCCLESNLETLGKLVAGRPGVVVGFWLALLAGLAVVAPAWDSVVQDGEFAFLPEDADSRVAERAFLAAFPEHQQASQIFVVVRRTTNSTGLTSADRKFVDEVLVPRLKAAVGFVENDDVADEPPPEGQGIEPAQAAPQAERLVTDIKWFKTRGIGSQLESTDNKATLVQIELKYEFLNKKNHPVVQAVEGVLEELRHETAPRPDGPGDARTASVMPGGLDLAVSGNAVFGRDTMKAAQDSAKATEFWTVILVVILLLAIYRAPLLALIPLATVALATEIARKALSVLAGWGWVDLFSGIETYTTVVVYGAGVDYCLFLIARYKEEMDSGATLHESVVLSLTRVGAALVASAGTVMCGIGMMVFAEFGKFQQAGVAITFGLAIVLLAALTFTPAMLRLIGRGAFWPRVPTERIDRDGGWLPSSSLATTLRDSDLFREMWRRICAALLKRPGTIWLTSVGIMLPFAIVGVIFFSYLSYGLLSELPDTAPSVRGSRAVQDHFPAGEIGPIQVLVRKPGLEFRRRGEPRDLVEQLTKSLSERREELGLALIRSWTAPLGVPARKEVDEGSVLVRAAREKLAYESYVSNVDKSATRLDLIPESDPFSRDSITQFNTFKQRFIDTLPEGLNGAEVYFMGVTASVADLKVVTDRDQVRIDILVLGGVFLILVILLRRPMISLYLIASVFFSYLATLGVTFAVFWAMDPAEFAGLDWKVPMFLFTILIAVGEDYNIFLMTRIDEESEKYGPVLGVTHALDRTGSIISSCGIIMAGTFGSLLAGSLMGMDQLGFALAFGVLLDTFVVRPILVPAYLILLHTGRFGRVGLWLGAKPLEESSQHVAVPPATEKDEAPAAP